MIYFRENSNVSGYLFDKETSSLDMTIVGLRREDIDTAKREIKKCCRQESADNYISGKDLSDIIRHLSKSQVCFTKRLISPNNLQKSFWFSIIIIIIMLN